MTSLLRVGLFRAIGQVIDQNLLDLAAIDSLESLKGEERYTESFRIINSYVAEAIDLL